MLRYFLVMAITSAFLTPLLLLAHEPTLEQIERAIASQPFLPKYCENLLDVDKLEILKRWGENGTKAHRLISEGVALRISNSFYRRDSHLLFLCDKDGNLRSAAVYHAPPSKDFPTQDFYYIEYLVSNPSLKGGGGRAAIRYLVLKAIENHLKGLELQAEEVAIEFYKGLGFEKVIDPNRGYQYFLSVDLTTPSISIKELLDVEWLN